VAPDRQPGGTGLFGRGLLYVVVWSSQILAATLVSPLLAHLLGPGDFGLLSTAIALHQLFMVVAVYGFDQAVVLQRVRDKTSDAARALLTFGLVLACLVTAITAVTAPWWSLQVGFDGFDRLLVATVLWTVPAVGVQLVLAVLLTEDRIRPFALVSGISAVGGQLIGIALLLGVQRDAATYAWGGVVSQFTALLIALALVRPSPKGLLFEEPVRRALSIGFPLMLAGLSYFVLNAGDRLVIQRLLGPTEAGRYQIAYVVGYVVVLLLTFTGQAWAPRIASVRDEAERWALLGRSRDELYRLLLPVIVGVTLGAPLLLRVVAPASFEPASLLLVVFLVALSAFPVVAASATGRALVTHGKTSPLAWSAAAAAALNVLLNLLLIPWFGIAGAAGATVVAFGVQATLQRRGLPNHLMWPGTARRIILAALAACAVSAVSLALPQTPEWIGGRFLVALLCLPWFGFLLRRAYSAERLSGSTRGSA
jgi:O-antigen/teichoic acid export membrane protein